MRRIAIVAAVLAGGCEEYQYGPELTPWTPDYEMEAPVDEPLVLITAFDFFDAEGDVAEAQLVYTNPEGSLGVIEGCRAPGEGEELVCVAWLGADPTARNFSGVRYGTMYVAIAPLEPWIGTHEMEVWLEDREGFESNHVTTVIEVIAPP